MPHSLMRDLLCGKDTAAQAIQKVIVDHVLSMRCAHPYQAVGTLYHPLCNTTDYRVSACAARPLLGALRPPGPLLGRRNGMTVPLDAMALLVPSNSSTTC